MTSFGCKCAERKKPVEKRNWAVVHRKCNYSYFEYPGGQWHSSEYSKVLCLSCSACGRTKAKYVDDLEDYEDKEKEKEKEN